MRIDESIRGRNRVKEISREEERRRKKREEDKKKFEEKENKT